MYQIVYSSFGFLFVTDIQKPEERERILKLVRIAQRQQRRSNPYPRRISCPDPKITDCWNCVVPKIEFEKKSAYNLKGKVTAEHARLDPRISRKPKTKVKFVDLRTEPIVVLVNAPSGSVYDHTKVPEKADPTENIAMVSARVTSQTECSRRNIYKVADPKHFQVPKPQFPRPKPEELFTVRPVQRC